MTKQTTNPRQWARPELKRLGEIRDVSGNQGASSQVSNNKT